MTHPTTWTKYSYLNALLALVAGMERDRSYPISQIAQMLGCDQDRARRIIDELRDLTVPDLGGLGEAIVPLTIEGDTVTLHGSLSFSVEHTLRLDRMQAIAAILALRMRGVGWDDPLITTLCESVTVEAPIEHLSSISRMSSISLRPRLPPPSSRCWPKRLWTGVASRSSMRARRASSSRGCS